MGERRVVTGGIHSFLTEIARISKTSSLHFDVRQTPRGYIIEHHWGRWRVFVEAGGVRVETDDGHVLTATKEEMVLNGERVDEICAPGDRCYTAKDVIHLAVYSVALWYWYKDDPHVLRLFAHLASL
jgi:hypothetical protein